MPILLRMAESDESSTSTDWFRSLLATGPYLWQSNAFYTGYSGFFQFCDAIEVSYAASFYMKCSLQYPTGC
jgi:hypothetical protein